MKIMDRLIRFSLYGMIFLSLFLSWKIWTNSGSPDVSKSAMTNEMMQNLKRAKDVFLPTQLIYHEESDKFKFSSKESLITNMTKELLTLEWEKISVYQGKSDHDLVVEEENTLSLMMAAPLLLNYFFEINEVTVNQKFSEKDYFDRIVVSFSDKKMYFINSASSEGYQVTFKESLKKVANLVKAEDARFIDVKYRPSNLAFSFFIEDEPLLKKYSYILGTQSYTVFSQAFFSAEEEMLSNTGGENSKDVNLLSDAGSNLTVRYSTGEVLFSGRFDPERSPIETADNIYSETYSYVQRISGSMGTLRYYEGNGNQIVYRNLVEGYPIFSDFTKGRVEVSKVNQNVQIATNQETIQVPIPSEEEVKLKNTAAMISELEKAGLDLKLIENIQIGYTWTLNEETKQAIDLVPEWYLKIDGIWENTSTIIANLKQEAGDK